MSSNTHKEKRVLPAFLVLLIALSVLIFGWICPIRYTFGIPCPGCGMTRALLALLQGDLKQSWFYSPMVLLSLSWLVFLYPFYKRGKGKIWLWIWMGMMAAIWMIRMVLYFPLAPMQFEKESLAALLLDLG